MKAVFFDAGGTLLLIDYARVARAVGRVLGREVESEAFVAAEYRGREAVERAMASGTAGSDGERWKIQFRGMLAELGLGEEEFAALKPAIMEEHARAHLWSVPAPGAAAALESLRRAGYLVACISNADGTVDRLLEKVGLLRHLEFVVDSGVVGVEKPDPRIFAIALERAGVKASDSCYLGDLFPVDVVGARNAGLVPVLLDPLGRYSDRGCRTAPSVEAFCRELVSAREAA